MVAFVILQFYNGAYNRMANEARKLSHALGKPALAFLSPFFRGEITMFSIRFLMLF
jgi:hypothetical protein